MPPKEEALELKLWGVEEELKDLIEDLNETKELGGVVETDPTQLALFKARLSRIDSAYEKFKKLVTEGIGLAFQLSKQEKVKSLSDLRSSTRNIYYTALSFKKEPEKTEVKPPTDISAAKIADPVNQFKLPTLNVPVFNGDISTWLSFKDTFISLIHSNGNLNPIQKFHYLKNSLEGPAAQTISAIPLTALNYDQAWDSLLQRFDNKRLQAANYLSKIFTFKPMGKATHSNLEQFSQVVLESANAFFKLNIPDAAGFILYSFALRSLDVKTRERFELEHLTSTTIPTFKEFSDFIHKQCLMHQAESINTSSQSVPTQRNNKVAKPVLMSVGASTCSLCEGNHRLYQCKRFTSLTPNKRFEISRAFGLCTNCLQSAHYAVNCPETSSCKQCDKKHHTLLHFPIKKTAKPSSKSRLRMKPTASRAQNNSPSSSNKEEEVKQPDPSTTSDAGKGSILSASSPRVTNVLLGTARANIRAANGELFPIRILIDCGSQRSFITNACVKALGLPTTANSQELCGFGDSPIKGGKYQATCTLLPKDPSHSELTVNAIAVPNITGKLPLTPLSLDIQRYFDKYELADISFGKPRKIDFLLGMDLFCDILLGESINTPVGYPNGLKTVFGWVIMGKIEKTSASPDSAISMMTSSSPVESEALSHMMQRFWEVETVPTVPKTSPEEAQCEAHFVKNYTRDIQGRYMVKLPFKNSVDLSLGDSYHSAVKRLQKLEYRLDKNQSLKREYSQILVDYFKSNYISEASNGKYFLPHHCVLKESASTRVRIVFDASFPTDRGSLNDKLVIGPKLQLDIHNVILNFRQYIYAVTADICKMYLQILVHPTDRQYLHFLYRFNSTDSISEFEINRLPFGLSCSPFLAIRTLRQLIVDEGALYPLASQALSSNIYVDDILAGADDLETAKRLQQELIELLGKGGFSLQKWSSNSEELNANVGQNAQDIPICFSEAENASVKILGMKWDPRSDCIAYDIRPQNFVLTKRGILSTIAKMYDPLGYLAPVIFMAKSMMQHLWTLKVDWDDPIPAPLAHSWQEFTSELLQLEKLRIPRCMFSFKQCSKTLIGFADASESGFAAALYLRNEYESGQVETTLLIAKTRLAPLKTLSIPRLELCAALLLVQTMRSISGFLQNINIDSTFLFSDSSIVLSWLRLPPHTLKTFVANRVVAILEHSDIETWYHVSSTDNAADIGSRGLKPSALMCNDLWWHGPEWLKTSPTSWPISNSIISPVPEMRPQVVLLLNIVGPRNFTEEINRCSNYSRLRRRIAYIMRFIHNVRNKSNKRVGPLTLNEIFAAEIVLIQSTQQDHFHLEVPLDHSKNEALHALAPFIDSRGIVRVGGRLAHSPLNKEAKFPILLPAKAHFTKLLIDFYHKCYLHAGPQLLYSLLQRKFWILSGRRVVKSRVHYCVVCSRFNKKSFTPYMGDLPPSRFEQGRCFIHTGIDFAGPFLIKESNRRKANVSKAYAALFVCFSTKAVHVEIVSQLSTEAFLASLDRFIARRGLPSKIHSDHGTNFVGADRQIKALYTWFSSEEVQKNVTDHLHTKQVQWEFIPPSSPHFGGLWEAGVKSFKHHLYRVTNRRTFTFEEMSTLAARIEAMLNSRPLYPLTNAPNETDVLTPGHFLIGGPLVALPEYDFQETSCNRLSRWQLLQQCIQDIWARWRKDYLNSLQQRGKWRKHTANIAVDTLVLLKEPKAAPLYWPVGRVVEIFPGRDGVVRVVKIKTPKGEYVRPVSTLAPLLPREDAH